MRRAVLALALALAACDGRSPTEPARYNVVSVISRTQDADTGALVPCIVTYSRSIQPDYEMVLVSPTGEAWAQLVPSDWQAHVTAVGYRDIMTMINVPPTAPTFGVTFGMRR